MIKEINIKVKMSKVHNKTRTQKKQIEKEIQKSKKIIRANYIYIMKPSKFINPHKIYKLYFVKTIIIFIKSI